MNRPGFFSVLFPQPGRRDFRDDAARQSRDYLNRHHITSILDTDESLCIPCDARATDSRLIWHAWLTFGFLWGPFLWIPCFIIYYSKGEDMSFLEMPAYMQALLVLLGGIGTIGFILSFMEAGRLRKNITERKEGFIRQFSNAETSWVHVNNGLWYDPYKLDAIVPWDQGFLILDSENRRLIIDGYFYRYQIMADDIEQIEPVTSNTSVLTRITCTIQNQSLNLMLVLAGRGTGAPTGPSGLILNDTLNSGRAQEWSNHLAASIGWAKRDAQPIDLPPPRAFSK